MGVKWFQPPGPDAKTGTRASIGCPHTRGCCWLSRWVSFSYFRKKQYAGHRQVSVLGMFRLLAKSGNETMYVN